MTEVDAALQKSVYATSSAVTAASVCLQALASLSLILNDVWSKEKLGLPNEFLATLYIPGFANHNGLREKLAATGYYFAFSCFFVFATQSVPGLCEDVLGFLECGSGSCISLVSKTLLLVLTDGTNDLFIEILNDKERTLSLCDRSRGNGTVFSRN
ncbi:MAG: hypothetical protein LUF91_03310 [Oscillospiraceae bacterium]|nr:hypothetical protein [Oscillospiraceae bacterium]